MSKHDESRKKKKVKPLESKCDRIAGEYFLLRWFKKVKVILFIWCRLHGHFFFLSLLIYVYVISNKHIIYSYTYEASCLVQKFHCKKKKKEWRKKRKKRGEHATTIFWLLYIYSLYDMHILLWTKEIRFFFLFRTLPLPVYWLDYSKIYGPIIERWYFFLIKKGNWS